MPKIILLLDLSWKRRVREKRDVDGQLERVRTHELDLPSAAGRSGIRSVCRAFSAVNCFATFIVSRVAKELAN